MCFGLPFPPAKNGLETLDIYVRERLPPELAALAAGPAAEIDIPAESPRIRHENGKAADNWERERKETDCAEKRNSVARSRFAGADVSCLADH